MCGIAGFYGSGTRHDLHAMAASLAHRGPDGEGFHVEESLGLHLAHRRLAILDIEGGAQPMWNEDGSVCVVFNGEIYNHLDLRRELVACGHRFRSDHSDTEVLVHGYEEWGDGLPLRLNGMFAFAIFDRGRRRLFLARDRFGEKPLFYVDTPQLFAFASEVTALLRHTGVDRTLDIRAIKKYLAYGLIPAPLSLYRAVRKLPAGWSLAYDLTAQRATLREYWRFQIEPFTSIPPDAEEQWAEELRHLLAVAVKRRLVSDVPLGIFLSGGIDSSTVLAFARKELPGDRTKTFSIGFREPSYDESAYARRVANQLATDHHEQVLSIEAANALIPDVLRRLDEPLVDSSILPTFLLCRFARQHVTVALGGDGGDELFAGYDPFQALQPASWYQRVIPPSVHRLLRALASRLPIGSGNMSLDFKLRRALRGVSFGPRLWNPVWLGALEPAEVTELFKEPVDVDDLYAEAISVWESSLADNLVDRTLEFFTRIYLPDDILTKVDRASMMVSMEVRAPLLDNDLVGFVRRLPHWTKYRNGKRKVILKKALSGLIPDEIINRQKKGFGIPLVRWLRDWQTPAGNALLGGLDDAWVQARWREHKAGHADHRHFLWAWIALTHHLDAVSIA
jgi:asparagine synthase (glutamine-hydrolysing)